MKWKLTGRFLLSVVLIVLFVTLINIVALFSMLIAGKPIFQSHQLNGEEFARNFQRYIVVSDDNIVISEDGKKELIENNAWIQILSENGSEIYRYKAPSGVQKKYTPLEIIQMYKYKEIDGDTTVFVGGEENAYSYFIGIKDRSIGRYVFTYNDENILNQFKTGSIFFMTINGIVALFIGYLFSKRLTKPLNDLIIGIRRLANNEYIMYDPKGVYKDVFYNMNYLSNRLKDNEKERRKLDQMKEEWISNISHDVKTPLASIQGYAEIMKDKDYEFSLEEMREYAEIIEKKALYMRDIIEDLNLATRLKNRELVLNKKIMNIVSMLRNIVIDTLNDSSYSDRNIEFHCSDEIINIDGDEVLLRRAIHNLIYNAIVHNDENVKIIVNVEKKERINIRIEDHGKGIKEEELERIFDRYYRGTNTGESHKGSGLGMAIANDIIGAHGGEIKVDSMIGCGTIIDIQI
ncbi:HAMP domain-containing sensor histidine kinase [Metabacillus fastidiosus]|uniref:sensor histidine kinase n=1 Tax=Metabacillus fastidiosus TaxID=1458 RepID=UPI002DB6DB55|nr:HAMP domain-containing sensor histidine kinase [Metabacillus fastidiosus]MEC2074996.1 HAMP domain-containing sensor histidine kinase [Metabacillus fastidiosus]